MASFADALVERHHAVHLRKSDGTIDAIRAVIGVRSDLSETVASFLDALVAYWGEVWDLEQRQEHAGKREREPLTAEDARRAVWYSALVMYELHRTFD